MNRTQKNFSNMNYTDMGTTHKAKTRMEKFELTCYACNVNEKGWKTFDKICELLNYYIAQISFGQETEKDRYQEKYSSILVKVDELEEELIKETKAKMDTLGYGLYTKMIERAIGNLTLVTSSATHEKTMKKELESIGQAFNITLDESVLEKCSKIAEATKYNLKALSTPIWIVLSESTDKPLDINYKHDTKFEYQLESLNMSLMR